MRTSSLIVILLFTAFVVPGFGNDADSLVQVMKENEVRLPETLPDSQRSGTLLIVTEARGDADFNGSEFVGELVRHRLSKAGAKPAVFRGNFRGALQKQSLEIPELLGPKILVEITTVRASGGRRYTVDCSLHFVTYRETSRSGVFVAEVAWGTSHQLKGISADEMDDAVGREVKREVEELIREQRSRLSSARRVKEGSSAGDRSSVESAGSPALGYRLRWNDPDGRRNSFFVGASVGTPALFNLHAGYWGSRSFPLVAGLSGMYFSSDRRGLQLELGWAVDNSGSLKHVVGVVGGLFNGTRQEQRDVTDQFGRVISTTIDTINEFHPYVGPAYTLQWSDFRLQGGLGFRADSSSEPSVRFLIQLGYTPALRF